jgi:5-methylcytosine-specific restriction endonuclease McrA
MPMNYELGYPDNWDAIAREVKVKANWTCQHCKKKCLEPEQVAAAYKENVRQWAIYTLTVHHIDHHPPNCHPSNLIALCSVCHRQQHAKDKKYGIPNSNQLSIF